MKLKDTWLLERKPMTNLDSILKSRDITLPTKVHLVKAMVFPVVMYGCESWTLKKAEYPRIDAFALWCWRRLLRVPRTARRSNQSILKEISPEYSLEGLMLKLKLQYFGHPMQRTGVSASASVLPMSIQTWFPLRLTGLIFLLSRRLSQESSSCAFETTIQKHQSLALSFLYNPTLTSIHEYWKNHSFDYMDLCQQGDISAFLYAV